MNKNLTIALAGNPNCGKTTLFNYLTGARQHVGNYPGVTVEKKEGRCDYNSFSLNVVDLPGTYSLTAYSIEEVVARDFLVNERPEVTIEILDASNLERNLYLALQFLELGIPVVIALNMIDVAKSHGISIDAEKLSELLDVPVVPIIARSGKGKDKLLNAALKVAQTKQKQQPLEISYGEDIDSALLEMELIISQSKFLTESYPSRWTALKYLEADKQILEKGRAADSVTADKLEDIVKRVTNHIHNTMDTYPEALIADHRYGYIHSIIKHDILKRDDNNDRMYLSDKIDKILTNRLLGPVIMLLTLMGLYQFTFTYSEIPVGWCESLFGWLGNIADQALPDGLVKSLVISGIIDGVGGVLGFVPLIMFHVFRYCCP